MYDNLEKLAATLEKQAVGSNAKYHARRAARLNRITESDFDYDPVAYKKFIRKLERRISQLLGKGDTVSLATKPTTLYSAVLSKPTISANTLSKLDTVDNIALSGRHKRRVLSAAPMHAALKAGVPNTPPVRQTLYRAFSPQNNLPAAFPARDRMTGKPGTSPTWFTHLLDAAGGYGTGGSRTYLGQYDLKALKRLGVVGPSTQHIALPTVEISPVVTLPKFLKTFQRFVPNLKKQLVLKSLRELRRQPSRRCGRSDIGMSPYYERVVVPKDLPTAQSLGNMSALYKRLPSNRGFQQVYSGGLTPRPGTRHNYSDLVNSVLGAKPITTPKNKLLSLPKFTPKRIAGAGATTTGLGLLPEIIRAIKGVTAK